MFGIHYEMFFISLILSEGGNSILKHVCVEIWPNTFRKAFLTISTFPVYKILLSFKERWLFYKNF